MKLDVLLRTCNKHENNPNMKRIVNVPREELILRCLKSLITSLNLVKNHNICLTIMDDSTPEFANQIQKTLTTSDHPTKYLYRELNNNESMHACYEYARDNFEDLILFTEDDYLFFPECISETLEAYSQFKHNLGDGTEVAIHPADSPLEYIPKMLHPERIVLGAKRHWRTSVTTSFMLLLSKKSFLNHYQKFMDYAKFDGVKYSEATTINHMFIEDVILFTPIPTLSFHLGYINPPSPHTSYEELWTAQA